MTIDRNSTLAEVAIGVGGALRRHGIRAVLTGGACASLYTMGRYTSIDADFVLTGETSRADLDAAMATVGFRRDGDAYVNAETPYFVEFLPGPVAIGTDDAIRPRVHRVGRASCLALSPTDSCRDRLAAFFHWKDRQSLDVAVQIALQQRLAWPVLKSWSRNEGFGAEYEEFAARVKLLRRQRKPRSGS